MDVEYENTGGPTSVDEALPSILCCLCGVRIQSNPSNMCVNCLRGQVDITTGISKQVTLFWCRGCGRYQKPPWVNAELESRELLAICLKKIKGLNKDVKLVDAGFVWTEPHSRRIKVKLTIQKEVFNAIMQQTFVVEFVVTNQQCTDCQKSYTEHTWNTVVQVRQKVRHKRTFYWLEQLLLKHNICEKALNIKEQPEGLDFYWGNKNQAAAMMNFLQSVVPIRSQQARRLISEDVQSNIKNYKFNIAVELVPICKDDLVLIPPKLAPYLGGCSPLLVCVKVTSCVHLVDPSTLKRVELDADKYWRSPFPALLNSRQLIEFTVLDIKKQSPNSVNPHVVGANSSRFALCEVTCARSSDFGVNDNQFEVMSHLGHLLKAGDTVMGYDLTTANFSDQAVTSLKGRQLPDIVLIRKTYPTRSNREKSRKYKLKQLPKEQADNIRKQDVQREAADLEDFMKDIDEDPEMRAQINLYRKDKLGAYADAENKENTAEEDGFPEVQLDELMEDLVLNEQSMAAEESADVDAVEDEVNDLDDSQLDQVLSKPQQK